MSYFYNRSIRNITSAFGSLFTKISVKRDGRIADVPLMYVGQDKFRSKQDEPYSTAGKVKMTLPRMSFRLSAMEIDREKQKSKFNRYRTTPIGNETGVEYAYEKVPYTFFFDLNVKTKTLDELWQVTEQILTRFDPHIDILMTDNVLEPENIKVKYISNELNDEYAGSFEDDRVIEETFRFEVEGFLHKQRRTGALITKINLDFSTEEDLDPTNLGTVHIDEEGTITITE